MFLFCNEDKKKKERLNSVLKTTHNLIKKNDIKDVRKNPVYSLIRAMSNYHLYDIVRELYEDEEVTDVQSIYKDIGEYLINSDKLNNSKSFELRESNINIDLSNLHMFNPYGSIPILDDDGDSTGWNIYMFRVDDKDIQNIINSSYAVKMELPECITDYDSFFEDLGFPKEVVRNGDVRIIKSNSRYITISYGDKSREIEKSRLEKYKVMVQTKCVVLKIKALWNSSENNLYGIDKKKAIKCIPDIENYEYVPVNNSMLAKAEIPFLIFERNRGKCFIEMY